MDLRFFVASYTDRGDDEEPAEHVEDPVEGLQQRDTGEDEHGAEHERTEDPIEQHLELVAGRDREVAEDHRPDEDVVNRQALLDEVAGQVLACGGAALPAEHDEGEGEPESDPHRRLDACLFEGDVVRRAVHEEQVGDQQHHDRADEGDPRPCRRREADELVVGVLDRREQAGCQYGDHLLGFAPVGTPGGPMVV